MTRIEIFEDEEATFSSSVISLASFNREQGVLFIEFLNDDSVACYSNISQPLFDSFKNAESAGKFYNQYIKGVKPSHVVEVVDFNGRRLTVNTDDATLIQMFYPQVTVTKTDESAPSTVQTVPNRFKIVLDIGIGFSSESLTLEEVNSHISLIMNQLSGVKIRIVEAE